MSQYRVILIQNVAQLMRELNQAYDEGYEPHMGCTLPPLEVGPLAHVRHAIILKRVEPIQTFCSCANGV